MATDGRLMPVAVIVAVPGFLFTVIFGLLLLGSDDATASCNPGDGTSATVNAASLPEGSIGGYSGDQLANAAHVLIAGDALGLGVRDQTIGVMTAMGESGLLVLDYGDLAGPDSRGLFQQRDNGAWGSYEDRMDPHVSATNFFQALMLVENRESLEPTIVANRVQRNADPWHYDPYWDAAVEVVEALAGLDTGLNPGTGAQVCSAGETLTGEVNTEGWAVPADGPITSVYGMRRDPVTGSFTRLHAGIDFAAGGCDGPIWATQAGSVIAVFADQHGGWAIDVDHGGVMTRYKHMYSSGILVSVGDEVSAGQQIGRTGSSGWSTGCHLHFEIHVDGSPVDPRPFLAEVGITV